MLLTDEYIRNVSSPYLSKRCADEHWVIDFVDVERDKLTATIIMTQFPNSVADKDAFHLSFITALEIVSQLQIIYFHSWAGLNRKTMEVWMAEVTMKSSSPIRDPSAIRVEMIANRTKKLRDKYYVAATHRVYDDLGGHFEVELKTFVA